MDLQAELASKLGLGKPGITSNNMHDDEVKSMSSEWVTSSVQQDSISIASSKKSKRKSADAVSIASKRSNKSKRGSSMNTDSVNQKGKHGRTKSIESMKSKRSDSTGKRVHKVQSDGEFVSKCTAYL